MKIFLRRLFSNNGVFRGSVYLWIAIGTYMGEQFIEWSQTPPANVHEVLGVLILASVNGANAVRAYVDQHLSRNPTHNESTTGGETK